MTAGTKPKQLGAQTALSPQARPGNQNAQKHSLYATRTGYQLRARRVRKLVQRMFELLPWLIEADRPAARAWADLEHKVAAVSVNLDQDGILNAEGDPRRLLSEYRGLLTLQLAYAKELGLTPAGRAALRVDSLRGDDLASRASRIRNGNDDH